MKVVVLTTSYPRDDGDAAGRFVADAVEHLRRRQIEVEVVSPKAFRHYGIAYGSGILGNLRREPWRAFLSPLMLASFRRAARRAAADADLIHAHWLPVGRLPRKKHRMPESSCATVTMTHGRSNRHPCLTISAIFTMPRSLRRSAVRSSTLKRRA